MTRWPAVLVMLLVSLMATPARAGSGALMRHVRRLIEPQMQGRRVGSPGEQLAADYIEQQMKRVGLGPAVNGDFRIETQAINRVDADATLQMGSIIAAPGPEFVVAGFSDNVDLAGIPVFAGFGIVDPGRGWNDYAGHDVRGRIVVVFAGGPPKDAVTLSSPHLTHAHAKAAMALSKGANAIIVVNHPSQLGTHPDETARVIPEPALVGIAVVQVTFRAFIKGNPQLPEDVSKWQNGPLPTNWALKVNVHRSKARAISVAGMLKGASGLPPIVLGAHFDGLGGEQYQGADDNASGVAVLLEVGRRLTKKKGRLKRTVVFVALTGEEVGLVGSRHVSRVLRETFGVGIYVNMDMVGRLDDRGLRVYGLPNFPQEHALKTAAKNTGLKIESLPFYKSHSDHVSFYEAGFQAVGLSTGIHPGYHSNDDHIDRLEWKKMAQIEVFVAKLLGRLATSGAD